MIFGIGSLRAQVGIVGRDGQIGREALRLYGLPEDAPPILYQPVDEIAVA